MRTGVRIGVDVGRVRIGLARSDPQGLLAVPLETVFRDPDQHARQDLHRIGELVFEYQAIELLVGLPLSLSGAKTASTIDAEMFAQALTDLGTSVRLIDERMSTITASQQLRIAGWSSKNQRNVIDQAAAVIILQQALDSERSNGRLPGRPID